jgi:hypothetical protein
MKCNQYALWAISLVRCGIKKFRIFSRTYFLNTNRNNIRNKGLTVLLEVKLLAFHLGGAVSSLVRSCGICGE